MPNLAAKPFAFLAALSLAGCGAPVGAPLYEAAPIIMEAAPVTSAVTVPARGGPARAVQPRAGTVTAGDIDDALNLTAFTRYAARAHEETGLPRLSTQRAVQLQLLGPSGQSAPGVRYTLRRPGAAEALFEGYSGVDGRITVLPAALGRAVPRTLELRAFPKQGRPFAVDVQTGRMREVRLPFDQGWSPDFLDLVFVVDTTGSMQDELDWLTAELKGLVRSVQHSAPGVDIRFGLVSYKAPGDPVPLRRLGFTRSAAQMRRWLAAEKAQGGAGGPEIVTRGLKAALEMPWRRGRGERIIIQIGDEPPQDRSHAAHLRAASAAARQGIHIYGLGASGVEDKLELMMRQAALISGGRYLFLTDDSGVGLAHAEPKISCYQVTSLTGLVERVLASELTGRRVEAPGGEVIRSVGSYAHGVCLE